MAELPERQLRRLITAVAEGDASRQDVVAQLREAGVDSLDVIVEVLAQLTAKGSNRHRASATLDPQRSRPQPRSDGVHRVPHVPFVTRGVLYDPADITRFGGRELHFVGGSVGGQPLVAIDDRETMERWWQLSLISGLALAGSWADDMLQSPLPHLHVPGGALPGDWSVEPTPGGVGPESFPTSPAPGGPPRTIFYEDVNYGGSSLELEKNRGYPDLTDVSWTVFGTGDWNDTISSIQTVRTRVAVLHEHINWQGSTYTSVGGSLDLVPVGWNDRASSVETW